MTIAEELLRIEEELWTGGSEAYHRNMDEECLVAFTQMSGVMTKAQIVGSVEAGPRWQRVRMEVQGLLQPTERLALLTYRAEAVRGEGEGYRALVSSGYVNRDGKWRMAFHQQTPLTG